MHQNKNKCPLCRHDIKTYKNNENIYHIIKIIDQENNTVVNNLQEQILLTNKRIFYLKMISIFIFIINTFFLGPYACISLFLLKQTAT